MTSRRDFLTRSGLALGALIVGDEMLEALDRLTHVRKSFPSASVEPWRWAANTAEPFGVSRLELIEPQQSAYNAMVEAWGHAIKMRTGLSYPLAVRA